MTAWKYCNYDILKYETLKFYSILEYFQMAEVFAAHNRDQEATNDYGNVNG